MKMNTEPETLLTATVQFMDNVGNCLCLNCKKQYGIIHECSNDDAGEMNYCPTCGAKILQFIQLEQDENLDDLIRRENQ